MMRRLYIPLLILVLGTLSSCKTFYPSVMLKTPRDYEFPPVPAKVDSQYTVGINDELSLELYANDGIRMIDVINSGEKSRQGSNEETLTYLVEYDGTVKFPVIGRIHLAGLTMRAAEDTIQKRFARVYTDPFARLKVLNKQVIVFPGSGGAARVVRLTEPNTTLIEALAEAGGITKDGKAYRVKLVRGSYDNPQVYLINLRTLQGLKDGDLVLQPNDLIYVEHRPSSREAMTEVMPWLASFTSLLGLGLTIYTLTKIK
ncbi:MAG: polysaccharide biosynthesis/export family protein [Flavobacteriales bacterium]